MSGSNRLASGVVTDQRGHTREFSCRLGPAQSYESHEWYLFSMAADRHTVFVVGAGFSFDLGYPLTSQLLPRVKTRFSRTFAEQFEDVVRFHHPGWDRRRATLPDIEQLLTELSANEDLLPAIRSDGPFDAATLGRFREDLLRHIAVWFHEIHGRHSPSDDRLLERFLKLINESENPAVISFNWDYELDKALFGSDRKSGHLTPESYGLNTGKLTIPALLKPHGSLNWYPSPSGRHIQHDLRFRLWSASGAQPSMYCFLRWRELRSKHGRRYIPWIVPPTHWKRFDHPMMKHIWKRCVDVLSTAHRVYFLGYSLPSADWHSRYIFRCGFHNQIEGLPLTGGTRAKRTGKAKVTVVNPDNSAVQRIETTCGVKARWIDSTIRTWLRSH